MILTKTPVNSLRETTLRRSLKLKGINASLQLRITLQRKRATRVLIYNKKLHSSTTSMKTMMWRRKSNNLRDLSNPGEISVLNRVYRPPLILISTCGAWMSSSECRLTNLSCNVCLKSCFMLSTPPRLPQAFRNPVDSSPISSCRSISHSKEMQWLCGCNSTIFATRRGCSTRTRMLLVASASICISWREKKSSTITLRLWTNKNEMKPGSWKKQMLITKLNSFNRSSKKSLLLKEYGLVEICNHTRIHSIRF